jgi:hypothetical protein
MKLLMLGILFFAVARPAAAESPPRPATPSLSYADLADLAVPAEVAAHVRIKRAIPLKKEAAASVPAGKTRFYVEAQVVSLIRAPQTMPAEIRYLADLPANADGKPSKLRSKSEHIILGSQVAGRPGELRLIAPDAQLPWNVERAETIRAILREAAAVDAPPRIVGIGRAFHVPGSLPGESETQLFLLAQGGRPVSLNVLRRPGQQASWAVALGEIVDEAAGPPQRNSLLWYRLACGLPRALPRQSLAEADPTAAAAIQADYGLVLEALGPCLRTRART